MVGNVLAVVMAIVGLVLIGLNLIRYGYLKGRAKGWDEALAHIKTELDKHYEQLVQNPPTSGWCGQVDENTYFAAVVKGRQITMAYAESLYQAKVQAAVKAGISPDTIQESLTQEGESSD